MSGSRRKVILVVDDDLTVMSALKEMLTSLGYAVIGAKDANEALDRIKTSLRGKKIDLFLLDIGLPLISGLDLLKTIRKELILDTPAMIMSGSCNEDNVRLALKYGASDILIKPLEAQSLGLRINRILG